MSSFSLTPIGSVRSSLTRCEDAPLQGGEGAPEAWIDVAEEFAEALDGIAAGDELIVITWLHEADRTVMKVHPRGDEALPLTGVFATRSPARPNPLGLHTVRVLEIKAHSLRVAPLEAIDGTPVVDMKPVLARSVRAQPLAAVRAVEASSRWYQRLLGCRSGHGGSKYERLLAGGELILQLHDLDVEHHHGPIEGILLWFEIDDFDDAVVRAIELGAEIVRPPHRNPPEGPGGPAHREIWLRDPDGHVVVLASSDGEAADQ